VVSASTYESLTGAVDADFPEYLTPPAEPVPLIERWLRVAAEQGVREPRAMSLATADGDGRPWQRIIAIVALDRRGILFCSHSSSRKARELAQTGWGSGLLYWRETGQQVILAGPVHEVGPAESDALWKARPAPLHAMSTVSRQSAPLPDPETLRAEAGVLAGQILPRPERFTGYRLVPHEVEFWNASADRMHRRLRYLRHDDDWLIDRLQP
jgi:pyridoxamine-phosphate oxidase